MLNDLGPRNRYVTGVQKNEGKRSNINRNLAPTTLREGRASNFSLQGPGFDEFDGKFKRQDEKEDGKDKSLFCE